MKKRFLIITLILVMVLPLLVESAFGVNIIYRSPGGTNLGPEIIDTIPASSEEGGKGNAVLINDEGEIVKTVKIIITPFAKRNEAITDIRVLLEEAYSEIKAADDMTDLVFDFDNFLQVSKEEAKDQGIKDVEDLTIEDFAVSDLFDVSIVDENDNLLNTEGFRIVFNISTPLKEDEIWFVVHNYEKGKWNVVEDCTLEGTKLTISLDSLSCLAFVRTKKEGAKEGTKDPVAGKPVPKKCCDCWFCELMNHEYCDRFCINGKCYCWVVPVMRVFGKSILIRQGYLI